MQPSSAEFIPLAYTPVRDQWRCPQVQGLLLPMRCAAWFAAPLGSHAVQGAMARCRPGQGSISAQGCPPPSGAIQPGRLPRWTRGLCGAWETVTVAFPLLHKALAHPCAGQGTACCGVPRANFVLRFESFLRAPTAMLVLAYEAWPICGDGLDLELRLTSLGAPLWGLPAAGC